uniref:Uncharacterized protein n=1 Tax=Plectus sambesii TaxID=2011161 RepID=A0A914X214_9BILA
MEDAAYDPACFYHRLSALPLVQEVIRQAVQSYEKTKDSSSLLNSALTRVENGVTMVAEKAKPTYDEYLQDKGQPETLLLSTIRMSSSALSNAADQLLKRSNAILSEPYRAQLEAAVTYVHSLDDNFTEAQSLFDVRDEVVSEAKERLSAVEKSLVGAVDRISDYPPLSWMAKKHESTPVEDMEDIDRVAVNGDIDIPDSD